MAAASTSPALRQGMKVRFSRLEREIEQNRKKAQQMLDSARASSEFVFAQLEKAKKAEAAGKNVSEYLVKGKETYTLKDVEGTFTLENIPAKKFADTYYFRLCQTDGKKVLYDKIFPYSVTSYCAKLLANGKNDEIDPLCMAIAQYSSAARDYFGYEING